MQAYHGADMPSNAAHFLQTIDEMFKGGILNPSDRFKNFLIKEDQPSTPVIKR
jgi:hypothetical protein